MSSEARVFWGTLWSMIALAAMLTAGAMYADPSPEACASWWRERICQPAAERALRRDAFEALQAALDSSHQDYNPELAETLRRDYLEAP